MDTNNNGWNASIDLLRISSALLVVFSHYELMPSNSVIGGVHGVCIFFIVSGYCMAFSVQNRTCWQFCTARLIRLLPAFFAAALITASLEHIFPYASPDRGQSLKNVAANLVCLPTGNVLCDFVRYFGKGTPINYSFVDGAYWSLLVEFRFYILLAVMIFLFKLPQKLIIYFLSAMALMAIIKFDTRVFSKQEDFLMYLPFFAFGMAYRKWHAGEMRTWILAIPLIAFGFLCYKGTEALSMTLNPQNWWTFALCFTVFFLAMQLRINASPLMRILGALSYPLYLLHQDIWYVVTGLIDIDKMWISLMMVPGMLALAYLVHRLIEQPIGGFAHSKKKGNQE